MRSAEAAIFWKGLALWAMLFTSLTEVSDGCLALSGPNAPFEAAG